MQNLAYSYLLIGVYSHYRNKGDTAMSFKTEFPDFPEADMPPLPCGFDDSSWHNDMCPSYINEMLGLRIFIDYPNIYDREIQKHAERFIVYALDENEQPNEDLLATDDWTEVLTFVEEQCRREHGGHTDTGRGVCAYCCKPLV